MNPIIDYVGICNALYRNWLASKTPAESECWARLMYACRTYDIRPHTYKPVPMLAPYEA